VLALLGEVGCGKSSLLLAILGELHATGGESTFHSSLHSDVGGVRVPVGYSGQRAWLMRGTARENILYGLPYDELRYQQTVAACALEPDFGDWARGDQTELGDRGVSVSGGQQSRIALARVVYARPVSLRVVYIYIYIYIIYIYIYIYIYI